jgi:hypothetical protein
MSDSSPAGTLSAAQLIASARQITARLPRLGGQSGRGLAAAGAVVRTNLISQWPAASAGGRAAAMLASAEITYQVGITAIPAPLQAALPAGAHLAQVMLGAGAGHQAPEAAVPAIARDEATLAAAAILLTLAALALPPPRAR